MDNFHVLLVAYFIKAIMPRIHDVAADQFAHLD